MDNINKKSLLEICSTISEHVLFIFPLLVDLISFYSIFNSKLQDSMLEFFGGYSWVLHN